MWKRLSKFCLNVLVFKQLPTPIIFGSTKKTALSRVILCPNVCYVMKNVVYMCCSHHGYNGFEMIQPNCPTSENIDVTSPSEMVWS